MTWTFKTESRWANELIYATISHCDGGDAEFRYSRPEHTLMLTLSGGSDRTRVKISGSPIYEGRNRAGYVTFAPAGVERQGCHRNPDLDFLFLLINPCFIRSCEFDLHARDLPSLTNVHDRLIHSVLWSLAREMGNGAAELPSIYAEHAAGLLMAHIVHSTGRDRSRHTSRAGLPAAIRRRVIDFIEESLGQDISLTALAALTGTGVDVFARNFKASVGVPPYRYVLERRLRRAQALLTDGNRSIADIAFEVGFSSQAHFTAQFSKVINMSPAVYRSLHRG
jgi:AraC family transcriptional regulator